jgi:hypothetical protein
MGESTRALFAARSLANDQPLVKSPARHVLLLHPSANPDGFPLRPGLRAARGRISAFPLAGDNPFVLL